MRRSWSATKSASTRSKKCFARLWSVEKFSIGCFYQLNNACARSCLRDPTLTKSDKRPTKELPPAAVRPLSGRPGRGRNPAGDRRGNGRSWSRRTRATYAKPARGDGCRRAAAQGWRFSLCVPRRRFGRRSSAWPAEMVAIAKAIITQRTGSFDPTTYRDRYQRPCKN
jgi:hypothetical protein